MDTWDCWFKAPLDRTRAIKVEGSKSILKKSEQDIKDKKSSNSEYFIPTEQTLIFLNKALLLSTCVQFYCSKDCQAEKIVLLKPIGKSKVFLFSHLSKTKFFQQLVRSPEKQIIWDPWLRANLNLGFRIHGEGFASQTFPPSPFLSSTLSPGNIPIEVSPVLTVLPLMSGAKASFSMGTVGKSNLGIFSSD